MDCTWPVRRGWRRSGCAACSRGDAICRPRATAPSGRPTARIAEGLSARTVATAAIDVSDGLAQDVGHLAQDSGCGFLLDAAAILAAGGDALSRGAVLLGADPLDLALYGGEDYALVIASAEPVDGFLRVGELAGFAGLSSDEPRARLRRLDGSVCLLATGGFDHFRV